MKGKLIHQGGEDAENISTRQTERSWTFPLADQSLTDNPKLHIQRSRYLHMKTFIVQLTAFKSHRAKLPLQSKQNHLAWLKTFHFTREQLMILQCSHDDWFVFSQKLHLLQVWVTTFGNVTHANHLHKKTFTVICKTVQPWYYKHLRSSFCLPYLTW